MTQEVNNYLQMVATPEYCAMARETMEVFNTFDYSDHEQELLNLAMSSGVSEETTVMQDIHFTLIEHCRELLTMHNITLVEEAPMDLMTTVLRGIYLMQGWEDKETLQRLLEQDADPEEIFADILQEVVGIDTVVVIDAIVDFDEAVNKRLSQILEGNLPEPDQEENEINAEQIIRLKNYNAFINNDKLLGLRLVRLGYRVGAPFDNYYRKVKRHLDTMAAEQFAQEIIVLALLGRDTWTSPSQAFNDNKVLFELELDAAGKIDVLIRDQWTKFQRFIPS